LRGSGANGVHAYRQEYAKLSARTGAGFEFDDATMVGDQFAGDE
jgi:hypothetical protein